MGKPSPKAPTPAGHPRHRKRGNAANLERFYAKSAKMHPFVFSRAARLVHKGQSWNTTVAVK